MATFDRHTLLELQDKEKIFGGHFIEKNLKSSSYDLRIGTIYKDDKIYSAYNDTSQDTVVVKPSQIITLLTIEEVKIPLNCIGTVFAINKMSSKGFLILNPGHIDPGFYGPISICAINLSEQKIHLTLGDPIFTIILNDLSNELMVTEGYQSKFTPETRREYEKEKRDNSFKFLSNSFFDLIAKHENGEELLKSILNSAWQKWTARLLGWMAFAIGIITIIGFLIPFGEISNLNSQIEKKDSLNILQLNKINELDSINITRKKIDSLNAIKIDQLMIELNKIRAKKKSNENSIDE